jgi:hypothetical protein
MLAVLIGHWSLVIARCYVHDCGFKKYYEHSSFDVVSHDAIQHVE